MAPYALLEGGDFAQQSTEFRVNGTAIATQAYGVPFSQGVAASSGSEFSAYRADGSELASTNSIVITDRQYLLSGNLQTEGTVNSAVSALWTTVDRPNQGFSLSAIPEQDRLVGSWFSYSTDGSERTWFILDSCGSPAGVGECTHPYAFDNQSADLTVYTAEGGTFGGAQAAIAVAGPCISTSTTALVRGSATT